VRLLLLSIDRVLQLLAEKKTIDKIADLAGCESDDVIAIIEDARKLISKHEKPVSKKKVIIKKSDEKGSEDHSDDSNISTLLTGAELSAVPLGSSLTIYVDGASKGNPGPAGIGLVIFDREDRQVGKISSYIGNGTNNYAEYKALLKALDIALYFETSDLKVRTDSELVVKQIIGEYKVKNDTIKSLHEQAQAKIKKFKRFRIEHVSRNFNEKADYLAKKASTDQKNF